jgi:DNA repair exonuclease SbcCD ATPase subunit
MIIKLKNLKNMFTTKQIYSKGSCEKTIEDAKNNIKKLNDMNKELKVKENELLVYKAATNAFSSYGIPAMIISTVLDSLQSEVNEVLETLRPSIQIQFYLEKERSDGKQEDTLGMKFFVNGVEWDYDELSGGQKACISLALKFAISVINRKRCGADIRILLLDECEQALDRKGIESFFEVVKKWSKDMTILIITHNEQLKEMFDSFILVSKNNGITTAKVVA